MRRVCGRMILLFLRPRKREIERVPQHRGRWTYMPMSSLIAAFAYFDEGTPRTNDMKSAIMSIGLTPSAPRMPLRTSCPSIAPEARSMSTAVRGAVLRLTGRYALRNGSGLAASIRDLTHAVWMEEINARGIGTRKGNMTMISGKRLKSVWL